MSERVFLVVMLVILAGGLAFALYLACTGSPILGLLFGLFSGGIVRMTIKHDRRSL